VCAKPRDEAVNCIARDAGVSARSIWDWFEAVEGKRLDDRLPFLAPRHRKKAKKAKVASCAPEFMDRLKTLYLRLEKPSFTFAYSDAVKLAVHNGWDYLCERTARRWLEEQVPRISRVFAREGLIGLEKCFPPMIRDKTGMVALEGVNADCHKIDTFVLWPGVDKPMRPQIVAFQDIFSGKILSWRVDRDPNKVAVMSAFGEMVETYGIPHHCLFDNGKEFANKWLTGGTQHRFKFRVREDDPLGVLPQLGIQVHFARPAHGQSKPIERSFRDMADRVAKDIRFAGAYVGNRPDAKPENYMSRAIPLADFVRVLEQAIADHNARIGRGSETARGRSFDETFAESYAANPIRKATAEQRRLWLMGQQVMTLHKTHGRLMLFKNGYHADWMSEIAGQKIIARFDPEDLHAGVYIYALDGSYLGYADCQQKVAFFNLAGAQAGAKRDAQRRRVERQLLVEYRTVSVDQVAAEIDEIRRPEPLPMEAKVVEMVQRARGPLIERPVPTVTVNAAAEAQHTALVVAIEARKAKAPTGPATARERFRWALELERAIERGEAVTAEQAQRLQGYQTTPEYFAEQMAWRYEGDAIFG
jgi:putative transposase